MGRGKEIYCVEDVGEGDEDEEADHELAGEARRRRRRVVFAPIEGHLIPQRLLPIYLLFFSHEVFDPLPLSLFF